MSDIHVAVDPSFAFLIQTDIYFHITRNKNTGAIFQIAMCGIKGVTAIQCCFFLSLGGISAQNFEADKLMAAFVCLDLAIAKNRPREGDYLHLTKGIGDSCPLAVRRRVPCVPGRSSGVRIL